MKNQDLKAIGQIELFKNAAKSIPFIPLSFLSASTAKYLGFADKKDMMKKTKGKVYKNDANGWKQLEGIGKEQADVNKRYNYERPFPVFVDLLIVFRKTYETVEDIESNWEYIRKYTDLELDEARAEGSLVIDASEHFHINEKINGYKNIKPFVLKRIKELKNRPYVISVEILKFDIDRKAINPAKLKLQKMYDAKPIEYCGMNLNINPSDGDCVPRALIKLYGKYISEEKILADLNQAKDDNTALEMPIMREELMKQGYTTEDVKKFCELNKISMYAIDHRNNVFEKYVLKNSERSKNKRLRPLIYMCASNHMYLVDDIKERKTIVEKSKMNCIVSDKAKTSKNKKFDRDSAVNINNEEYKNTNIFYTEQGKVNEMFYKYLNEGKICNANLKMTSRGVVRFNDPNKNIIYENTDYKNVIETIERLNDDEITFKNQTTMTLAYEYFNKNYQCPKSMFNKEVEELFRSELSMNHAFNDWFAKPENIANCKAIDMSKHYSSVLRYGGKYGWCVFSPFDEVKPFDGKLKAGRYNVETDNYIPFHGDGWYDANLVTYALEEKIITLEQIKYQLIPSMVLERNYFRQFVDDVYKLFKNPKDAINKLCGLLAKMEIDKDRHYFTTDREIAISEFIYNDCKIRSLDIENGKTCYHLIQNLKIQNLETHRPIHQAIYDLSAIEVHKLIKKMGGTLLRVHTDEVFVENGNNIEADKRRFGGYRYVKKLPIFEKIGHGFPRKMKYEYKTHEWTEILKRDILKGSCLVIGSGGTGKSTLINNLKETIDGIEDRNYKCIAFTHKACLKIDANTIHHELGINPADNTYCKSKIDKLVKEGITDIFIDEVSMVSQYLWSVIANIKRIYKFRFIGAGDFNQLKPVEEGHHDYFNSYLVKDIFDGKLVKLTYNYRVAEDKNASSLFEDFEYINNCDYDMEEIKKHYGNKRHLTCLAWTNKCVNALNKQINNEESEKYEFMDIGEMKIYKGLPLLAKKTMFDLKNNEDFVVTEFDKDSITVESKRIEITFSIKKFKVLFRLAYAMTVHKVQGQTVDHPFSIYEAELFDKYLLYTAMSRTTKKEYINFCDFKTVLMKGFIYMITNKINHKIYIGSTFNYEQRMKEHMTSTDDWKKLYNDIKKYGKTNFEHKIIKEVYVEDEEKLFEIEQTMLDKYQSIAHGYNNRIAKTINDV